MGKTSTDTAFAFKSSLKTGAERFLAQALAHVLAQGFRTADDFLRHFKPLDLMIALESAHELRAEILVKAAGVHQKIAIKKSTTRSNGSNPNACPIGQRRFELALTS